MNLILKYQYLFLIHRQLVGVSKDIMEGMMNKKFQSDYDGMLFLMKESENSPKLQSKIFSFVFLILYRYCSN